MFQTSKLVFLNISAVNIFVQFVCHVCSVFYFDVHLGVLVVLCYYILLSVGYGGLAPMHVRLLGLLSLFER